MSESIAYTYGENFAVINFPGDPLPATITVDHPNFTQIIGLLASGDHDVAKLRELVDIKTVINEFLSPAGDLMVDMNGIYYQGEPLALPLCDRILGLMRDGYDVSPLVNFLKNLLRNPERRAVFELYGFLEQCNVPLTEDGYFITYKIVCNDYRDCYSGKFDNSVGQKLRIDRWKVDPNPDQTCSHGLHVCSRSYLPNYGHAIGGSDRIMICKVDPADVVAIPRDYNNAKMRACAYEVVGEIAKTSDAEAIWAQINRIEGRSVYDAGHDYTLPDDEDEDENEQEDNETVVAQAAARANRPYGYNVSEPPMSSDEDRLFVRDTHAHDVYYPAARADITSGATLYKWDTQIEEYVEIDVD